MSPAGAARPVAGAPAPPGPPSSPGPASLPGPLGRWWVGARPRTLGAAVGPVLVGTGVAASEGEISLWRLAAALVVALGLQVGTNYANDASDGVRGTDVGRVGPLRLTASGLASPTAVRRAAALAFTLAALAGLVLAVAVDLRLLVVGALALAAGPLYTGGPRPYGYRGWGEAAVLVFFGVVATAGSAYVQQEALTGVALAASVPVGLLAATLLMANNLRDLEGDRRAGKQTLAVRLGSVAARRLFVAMVVGAFGIVAALGTARPAALLGLVAAPLAVPPVRVVLRAATPPELVPALMGAARLHLAVCVLLAVGLWWS